MGSRRILSLDNSTYLEYRCGTCNGSGRNPYGHGSCDVCDGTGILHKKAEPGNYVETDCGPCKGTGKNPYGDYSCDKCSGTGRLLKRLD